MSVFAQSLASRRNGECEDIDHSCNQAACIFLSAHLCSHCSRHFVFQSVGAQKLGMSFETQGNQTFGQDIPKDFGTGHDSPRAHTKVWEKENLNFVCPIFGQHGKYKVFEAQDQSEMLLSRLGPARPAGYVAGVRPHDSGRTHPAADLASPAMPYHSQPCF